MVNDVVIIIFNPFVCFVEKTKMQSTMIILIKKINIRKYQQSKNIIDDKS